MSTEDAGKGSDGIRSVDEGDLRMGSEAGLGRGA